MAVVEDVVVEVHNNRIIPEAVKELGVHSKQAEQHHICSTTTTTQATQMRAAYGGHVRMQVAWGRLMCLCDDMYLYRKFRTRPCTLNGVHRAQDHAAT